jgi:hypothetical protein
MGAGAALHPINRIGSSACAEIDNRVREGIAIQRPAFRVDSADILDALSDVVHGARAGR